MNKFFKKMIKEVDDGKVIEAIYQNFSNAVDKVSHKKLVDKIEGRHKYYTDNLD